MEWTDHPREDLRLIPVLKEKGFEPKFEPRDRQHGRITPDNVPHWPVEFYSPTEFIRKSVWRFPHWYRCPINGNGGCKDYPTLEDAVNQVNELKPELIR